MPRRRINWSEIVEVIRTRCLPYFQSQDVKPTLRTIFYWLVSQNLIPNTKSSYKTLSRVLVKARKEGTISFEALADKTRYTRGSYDDHVPSDDKVFEYENECDEVIDNLTIDKIVRDLIGWFKPTERAGFWAGQPYYVEIWLEKDALADTIENWTRDLFVKIRVNRGYPSWTFLYNSAKELLQTVNTKEKEIVILYLGDHDPSGIDIERFTKEALQWFKVPFKIIRVAVTPEQVDRYNLPPRPEDAETIAKLMRDPRSRRYQLNYIVELDALVAYAPDDFRNELRSTILSYWDRTIYEDMQDKARLINERIEEVFKKKKKELLERLKELVETELGGEDEI